MKTRATIFGILIVMGTALFSQVSKPKSKTSASASKSERAKTVITKGAQTMGVPANAYYYKSSGKADTISISYKSIVIEGDNNKLYIREGNDQVFIKGKNNDINMKSADYIEITGDGNFVSWETTKNPTHKPVVQDKGGYNNVGKRANTALNKAED